MLDPGLVIRKKRGGFALSIDVEDYFQVWAFSDAISRADWSQYEYRAGAATRSCLALLAELNIRATFFTLGWIAQRDPSLIKEIVAGGHELASHGCDHRKVNALTAREFKDDISESKKRLEDAAGAQVRGYRAPGFSIDRTTPWAYDALIEAGYSYSSSAHPIAHDHYGDPNGSPDPFFPRPCANFIEAPVATVRFAGRRVSCGGGGWFRAMPVGLSAALLRMAAGQNEGPVIFYFHPWEIDPGQPRVKRAKISKRFRHYLNLHSTERKLRKVLPAFDWGRLDEALAQKNGAAI